MHTLSLTSLPAIETTEDVPRNFAISHPYLLLWTDQIDVWSIDSSPHIHVCTLAQYVDDPGLYLRRMHVVVDERQDIVVIPEPMPSDPFHKPPTLWVFKLSTGELVKELDIYGSMEDVPLLSSNGLALTLISRDEAADRPKGNTEIVVCDLVGIRYPLLNGVKVPSDLREGRERGDGVLYPVHFSSIGDLVATSTSTYQNLDYVDLLLWRDVQNTEGDPDVRGKLHAVREGTTSMLPSCYTDLSDTSFVLCIREDKFPPAGHHDLTSVYAIDSRTLSQQWQAEPICGQATYVKHVPALGVIVVAGTEEKSRGEDDAQQSVWNHTFVVVLDASAGTLRKMDIIDSDIQDEHVVSCAVSFGDEPAVVIVWRNGHVCAIPLDEFITRGFDKDGDRVHSSPMFPPMVDTATVGERSVYAITGAKYETVETGPDSYVRFSTEDAQVHQASW